MGLSNPNFSFRSKHLTMDSKQQLVDSLTAHISLYSSHSHSQSSSSTNNPRSSILKWFSSLTVHQRQAQLTTVDPGFTQILLQMLSKLQSNGHGFFILLPDIPSPDNNSSLPSLCHRKSHGLLARVSQRNEFEKAIRESIRLFSSKEGEMDKDVLDSMTMGKEFVGNVDRFVEMMDGVSDGGFLRGDNSELGSEWAEMEWLKSKGYYSMEAFVANRLEVSLRLAWLNSNSGKKRGVKLKEKMGLASMAVNLFWRKKGCVDWWDKLNGATRRKVFHAVLGKAAKSMASDLLKWKDRVLEYGMWHLNSKEEQALTYNCTLSCKRTLGGIDAEFDLMTTTLSNSRQHASLDNLHKSLFVLQGISTMLFICQQGDFRKEELFFSSLGSISTISDFIFRKLRGLIMVVSLDCTKIELLEEGNTKIPLNKSKAKTGSSARKKKGKTRSTRKNKPDSRSAEDGRTSQTTPWIPKSSGEDLMLQSPSKIFQVDENGLECGFNVESIQPNKSDNLLQDKGLDREITMSAIDMECGEQLVKGNVRSAGRKSKKEGNKCKGSYSTGPIGVESCQRKTTNTSSISVMSQDDATKSERVHENLIVKDGPNDASVDSCTLVENIFSLNISNDLIRMDILTERIEGDSVSGSAEGSDNSYFKCKQTSNKGIESGTITTKLETESVAADSGIIPPVMPLVELDDVVPSRELDTNPIFSGKQAKKVEPEREINTVREQESFDVYDVGALNSSGYVSCEWPSLTPVHLTSFNSHLPAATERLHLDVGLNWQNHFHQPFVQTVHQVRNPKIGNGCNTSGIPSQSLPMSMDWPPMVRSMSGMAPSVSCNYDTGFMSRQESSFQRGFATQNVQCNTIPSDDERKYSSDLLEFSDLTNAQDDNHWISEEEFEVHAVSNVDYNQYFGGGVMYWNPSDHPVTGFSRPPSLSSDDSSWAWREADMNMAVDDMVAFSSSYNTNGFTSPSAASFCSSFDPLVPAHQALGYVIPGGEVNGKMMHSSSAITDVSAEENASRSLSSLSGDGDAKTGDSLPYPVLRPIIIPNMSRERSRSDFKRSHDHNSPCIPPNRRERPRIKRPPSPVVLCVPRAPPPPPPSPVGDSRKQRGFATVRSGSSSPRHWGVRGWFHDGNNFEESCIRMDGSEVVWPSWRNKCLSALQLSQPLPGALLQDHLIAISQLPRDPEHPDVAFPLQPPELLNCSTLKASLSVMHSLLHNEIDSFWKKVASGNLIRKPYINWAVKRVTRSLQVLWPRSRTNIFGSNATGLSLPTSDVDLVVSLPPVRNLEPIKEAGILEGRNGIKETCLQHAARYLANQEWVKNDSLKIVENTAIPIIMLVIEVPHDFIAPTASNAQTPKEEPTPVIDEQNNPSQTDVALDSTAWPECLKINNNGNKDVKSIRMDISFKSPSHTGRQTTELVKGLTEQFPATVPLALVLKQFLADRSLDQSYSGGLSSYCLVLLIIHFLQNEHHHGRPINQNFGSLLMDFLYFFGNVFDPRQMRVSIQGSGLYINRERGYSIDPIYIDDPLFPTNNVGRNCFRIHQCIKAFADAYATLENELDCLPDNGDLCSRPSCKILQKIIPSIGTL